jgi:DNA-binding response OmpR family regulator
MSAQRIVLVEDDEDIRTIAQMALEQLGGYEVLACASGAQALAEAAQFRPDLLLLDVSMPGMDGPETLAALRKQAALASVPAAFLTAHTAAKQVSEYRSLNAVDVIAKPFDPEQLCKRVAAMLAKSAIAPAIASDSIPSQTAQGPVALVVEDDPSIRYLLGFILEQHGWTVLEAHDGPQGVAAILDGPVTDAVLLDIMLPGVDGLQLLDILRGVSRWKGVPVMMLTAKGDESSINRALAAGANDYLGKPFEPDDLVARLNRMPRAQRRSD